MSSIASSVAALQPLDSVSESYLNFHLRRYEFLLRAVEAVRGAESGAFRILDIGTSFQTVFLRERYPDAVVDTLGFRDYRFPARAGEEHFEYDLNRADADDCGTRGDYDLIVLAEVIEHLHIAPSLVLRRVGGWLRPGGKLILQTPNPVSLGKRLRMLFGGSPFEMIREDASNPGHFCEYTVADLRKIAGAADLGVISVSIENYFGPAGFRNFLYSAVCAALPGELADGITMLLRKTQ